MNELIELCPGLQREPFIEIKTGPGYESPADQAAGHGVTSATVGNIVDDLIPYFQW